MCEICDKLKYIKNKKSKVKVGEDFLYFDPKNNIGSEIIMEMVLDDNDGKPDLCLHTYFHDQFFYHYNAVFDDLHYCPRCGKKIA